MSKHDERAKDTLAFIRQLLLFKRSALHMTLRELAKVCGVPIPTLNRFEKHGRMIDALTFLKIVEWLKP